MHLPMNQNESSTHEKVFGPGVSNLFEMHLWCANTPRMIIYIVRNIYYILNFEGRCNRCLRKAN